MQTALSNSPAAERMRRLRERRREKIRLVTLDIFQPEIESLIKLGYLEEAKQQSKHELEQAFYRFLDQAFPTMDALNEQRDAVTK